MSSQRQLMTFHIGEQLLGVDIMAIREIRTWSSTTPLPLAPPYVHGVVNLRGAVLPVIDLSARLGWGRVEPTEKHVIIVLMIKGQLQGLIVDAVNDIVTINAAALQSAPDLEADAIETGFIEGLVALDNNMLICLSVEALSLAHTDITQQEAA